MPEVEGDEARLLNAEPSLGGLLQTSAQWSAGLPYLATAPESRRRPAMHCEESDAEDGAPPEALGRLGSGDGSSAVGCAQDLSRPFPCGTSIGDGNPFSGHRRVVDQLCGTAGAAELEALKGGATLLIIRVQHRQRQRRILSGRPRSPCCRVDSSTEFQTRTISVRQRPASSKGNSSR